MEQTLKRIQTPWRRRLITSLINFLLWLSLVRGPRAQAHWIGRANRRRRPERLVYLGILVISFLLVEPHQYMFWSVMWGGTLSIFLNLHTVYRFLPRKRAHWI